MAEFAGHRGGGGGRGEEREVKEQERNLERDERQFGAKPEEKDGETRHRGC